MCYWAKIGLDFRCVYVIMRGVMLCVHCGDSYRNWSVLINPECQIVTGLRLLVGRRVHDSLYTTVLGLTELIWGERKHK